MRKRKKKQFTRICSIHETYKLVNVVNQYSSVISKSIARKRQSEQKPTKKPDRFCVFRVSETVNKMNICIANGITENQRNIRIKPHFSNYKHKVVNFRVSTLRIIPPFCWKGEEATPSWSQRVLCSARRIAHCSAAEEPSLTFNQKIQTVSNQQQQLLPL